MKIGILSMQKIHNYGSFLQAFSLKKEFEKRGCDVYFIDIEKGRQICPKDSASIGLSDKFDKYFFKRIQNYLLHKKMDRLHINDYETYLETAKCLKSGELFDVAVIGSDEVFNATTPSPWGFTTQLFGNIDNAKRVVTYAASCGTTTLDSVCSEKIDGEIKNAFENIEAISVRDKNTLDFVKGLTGITPQINVDPVFLADYDSHIVAPKIKKPYMLVYAYANRIEDEKEIRAIKRYAKNNGLEILCVGMQQRWCKHNKPASAFELLGYVKNAECIVTDTFHGTVFSIKYNKKFISLIRESNKQKLCGLLRQFDLYVRAVFDTEALPQIMDAEIDYKKVNDLIKSEQEKSSAYLDEVCRKA